MNESVVVGCELCAYNAEHGWWGPGFHGSHCRRCHKNWSGLGRAHCTVCCETFSTDGTARAHWVRGVHVPPAQVLDKDGGARLELRPTGIWHQARSLPGELWGNRKDALEPSASMSGAALPVSGSVAP